MLRDRDLARLLIAFSDAEDVVCEPFAGAGTQLILAESIGRRCYARDSPAYCDVAVKRWSNSPAAPLFSRMTAGRSTG
jgi:DNA modification methylase